MPVQINITGADAAESLKELAALAAGFTSVTPEAPKPARTRSKPVEEPKQESEQQVDTEPATADEEPAVTVTPEELRAKAQAVAKSGKQPEVKGLLTKFGVKSISEVAEGDRSAFMAELEAL